MISTLIGCQECEKSGLYSRDGAIISDLQSHTHMLTENIAQGFKLSSCVILILGSGDPQRSRLKYLNCDSRCWYVRKMREKK